MLIAGEVLGKESKPRLTAPSPLHTSISVNVLTLCCWFASDIMCHVCSVSVLPSREQHAFINGKFPTFWKMMIFFYHHGYIGLRLTIKLAQMAGSVKDLSAFTYKTRGVRWWLMDESAGPLSGSGCGLAHLISWVFYSDKQLGAILYFFSFCLRKTNRLQKAKLTVTKENNSSVVPSYEYYLNALFLLFHGEKSELYQVGPNHENRRVFFHHLHAHD